MSTISGKSKSLWDAKIIRQALIDSVRKLDPFFDSNSFGSLFRDPEHRAKIASALRKAGL